MTDTLWNPSAVIGPRQVAIYSDPDAVTGEVDIVGVMPGYRLIVAWAGMTPDAQAFLAQPQPTNPQNRFSGDTRSAGPDGRWRQAAYLVFADGEEGEAQARAALPNLWVGPVEPPAEPEPEGVT